MQRHTLTQCPHCGTIRFTKKYTIEIAGLTHTSYVNRCQNFKCPGKDREIATRTVNWKDKVIVQEFTPNDPARINIFKAC